MRRHSILTARLGAALVLSAGALAQHVPETEPRPGEKRLNQFQFMGSHNAFQRGIPLDEQVDDWGNVFLEIDVWYDADEEIYEVQHNCCDIIGEDVLENDLANLAGSHAADTGLIVLDFQFHSDATGGCSYCFDPYPANWRDEIWAAIINSFSEPSIYQPSEFQADMLKWPSPQELIRRGKHLIVTGNGIYTDARMFSTFGSNYNEVLHATDDETQTYDLGDKYLSEWYPTGGTCIAESHSTWSTAVSSGFTFPTTYCVDDTARILDPRIHPPVRMYVNGSTSESEQLGTWGRPYAGSTGLRDAVARLRMHQDYQGGSNVTIVLESGTHDALGSLGGTPPYMTLVARNGPVTLVD